MKSRFIPFLFLLSLSLPLPVRAGGIPVFDAANLQQSAISAVEAVNQTLKQIEQYALQLQQYEDMIKNSIAPAAYVWDQAQRTMNKIIALQNQVEFYMSQAGNVDTYLRKFGNVAAYRGNPYFQSGGGTEENRKALLEAEELGSKAQKNANDNVVKTLENQQTALKADAANLEQLQAKAQSSQGGWKQSSTRTSLPATNRISSSSSGGSSWLKSLRRTHGIKPLPHGKHGNRLQEKSSGRADTRKVAEPFGKATKYVLKSFLAHYSSHLCFLLLHVWCEHILSLRRALPIH